MVDVLIFGAHPDDVEFAMGGTLLKLIKGGFKVAMIVLTKGELGTRGTPEIRVKEAKAAAKKVGCEIEILDFEDGKIENDYESRLKIVEVVRKHKPKVVFAPYHTNKFGHRDGAAHSDHWTTGKLVRDSLRLAKFVKLKTGQGPHFVQNLVYYMVPRDETPTLINDVTPFFDEWVDLVKTHKSQVEGMEELRERLEVYRRRYGHLIGVKYGEAFKVDEPIKMTKDIVLNG